MNGIEYKPFPMYHRDNIPSSLNCDPNFWRRVHEGEIGIYEEPELCPRCLREIEDLETWDGLCYDCIKDMYDPMIAIKFIEEYCLTDYIDWVKENSDYVCIDNYSIWFEIRENIKEDVELNRSGSEAEYLKEYVHDADFTAWADFLLDNLKGVKE